MCNMPETEQSHCRCSTPDAKSVTWTFDYGEGDPDLGNAWIAVAPTGTVLGYIEEDNGYFRVTWWRSNVTEECKHLFSTLNAAQAALLGDR